MTWVRFLQDGQSCWGQIIGDHIQVCVGSPLDGGRCRPHPTLERLPLEGIGLLPPCLPTKIVCVGRNYRDHAAELGNPVPPAPLLFLKPPSSLLAPGGAIELLPITQHVDYEGELAVVVKRRCRRLPAGADIRPYILGFTCLNDVTSRDLQRIDTQWTRAKGCDTFCPVGPWLVENPSGNEREPWDGLQVETRVNGELRQSGNTRDFIFPLPEIFRAITEVMTLEPGDLIATGTPAGVGRLHPGDRVIVSVSGIGALENSVVAAAPAAAEPAGAHAARPVS